MRNVFSAIRRSLTSVAIAFASSDRGARKTSRSVASTGLRRCREASAAVKSSNVIARAPRNERGAGSPSPLMEPYGAAGSMGAGGFGCSIRRLLGRSLRHREHRHENAALGFGTELDATVDQREQRVVLGQADIGAGMPFGAALPRNDVAGEHLLTAENLQAEPLAVGVAAVAG